MRCLPICCHDRLCWVHPDLLIICHYFQRKNDSILLFVCSCTLHAGHIGADGGALQGILFVKDLFVFVLSSFDKIKWSVLTKCSDILCFLQYLKVFFPFLHSSMFLRNSRKQLPHLNRSILQPPSECCFYIEAFGVKKNKTKETHGRKYKGSGQGRSKSELFGQPVWFLRNWFFFWTKSLWYHFKCLARHTGETCLIVRQVVNV